MLAHDADVVRAVEGDVAVEVGAGQEVGEEFLQTAADVLPDLGLGSAGRPLTARTWLTLAVMAS
jgi:hypothetical protein